MNKKYIFLLREILGIIFLILIFSLKTNINYLNLILCIIGYLIVSYDVLYDAIKNITKGKIFDENFLMIVASISAIAIKEYPEALLVMILYQVGEYFQGYAVDKSRKSISDLMDIRPEFANLVIDENIEEVDPYDVNIDDIILIKVGERVPLDCIVIEGDSYLDTKSLTGESKPLEVKVGDNILSGSINTSKVLKARVTKLYEDSTVETILTLVEEATDNKSKSENFISKFAKYYTPIVVILAFLLAILPPLILRDYSLFSKYIAKAASFLVISCPCALVISVPLTYFSGIGRFSKEGILVKGSNYIETLAKIKKIYFDKTGTLTKGNFKIDKIEGEDTLKYAAYGEFFSNHPVANIIKAEYKQDIIAADISNYEEIAGYGLKYLYKDKQVLVGNSKLLKENNIDFNEQEDSGTKVYVALDNSYLGYILIVDEIKENAYKTIMRLKDMNIKTIMLSGDNKNICNSVKNALKLDDYHAELLPQDKLRLIEEENELSFAFVGDGINDSAALVRSDCGISMGGVGSDAAIEASDVVICDDDISKVYKSISLSKRIMTIVYQNIIFALAVKFLVLILSLFGITGMFLAIFADVGVSVIAILNAMRAFKLK